MGQGTPSVEPSILNSPPAVYHEWYKSQPRTRQCDEDIERLCMFLSGAAVRVSQIICAVVRRDEPRPCAIPDALLDEAIEFAQHAKDDAEQLIVRVRGVWTEIPSAVSFDPRGWETDLLMRLEQARLDAGCVALTLSTRKGGWPVPVQEAQEWKTALGSHIGPLMERHRALKSIPAPASPGEASPNTDHGVANAIERAAELGAERAAEKVARVFGRGDNNDVKSPDRAAGAEAIDEHDAALLAFLNRNPSLRRKVSDVLPDKGPQDRKAVAKRLRKLANRTPPLVDYPKDGRSGVAILPAGMEALKRATAPTPR